MGYTSSCNLSTGNMMINHWGWGYNIFTQSPLMYMNTYCYIHTCLPMPGRKAITVVVLFASGFGEICKNKSCSKDFVTA